LHFQCVDGLSAEEKQTVVDRMMRAHWNKTFFVQICAPSPYHWIFQQSYDALLDEYYIPGVSGMLNAIEASLRFTISDLDADQGREGDFGAVLSNALVLRARKIGLDVSILALPGERDFDDKLNNGGRANPIGIVKLRNSVCHGNLMEFVSDIEVVPDYFVPELLLGRAVDLVDVAVDWVFELARFRHLKGLPATNPSGIEKPTNLLRAKMGSAAPKDAAAT
jgi:hypothetical protein